MTTGIAISFCTTCQHRLYQLREALPVNLETLGPGDELVLVDYASPDGLCDWVWSNFRRAIDIGKLQFFEVKGAAPWHASKAKNLAHRLARGDYLFNLDADNFIFPSDVAKIRDCYEKGVGSRQFTRDLRDGTAGRIGLSREQFMALGGYDESLMGMLVQDLDLIIRAEAQGYRFARLGPPERMPIQNSTDEKLANLITSRRVSPSDLNRIAQVNLAYSELRRELEGACRRQNFATFEGRLNGLHVVVDGLGNIRRA